MTSNRRFWLGVVAVLAFGAVAPAARACDGWCSGILGYQGTAYGVSGSLYGLGIVPAPPYFALHPPVYYGERYFRSYGESPFARPDFSSRPRRVQAEIVINPFIAPAAPSKSEAAKEAPVQPQSVEKVTSGPQMINNPFYQREDKVASK